MAPLAYRQGDQLWILIECLGGDDDIGIAGDHPIGDLRRAALVHLEFDCRMLDNEIAHHDRQRIARLGMGRRQNQPAALTAGKFRAGSLEVFGFAQDAFGNRQHRLARLGDSGKAFAAAFEDRHPQFFLEQLDLLGNPWLRGEQRLGGFGDVETLALDFDDVTQLLEFHGGTK